MCNAYWIIQFHCKNWNFKGMEPPSPKGGIFHTNGFSCSYIDKRRLCAKNQPSSLIRSALTEFWNFSWLIDCCKIRILISIFDILPDEIESWFFHQSCMFIRLVTYTNLVLISQLLKELLRILSKIISFFNDLIRL